VLTCISIVNHNDYCMNEDEIIEQFHYFNIQADIDSVYGNWAMSSDGDVVNYLYPYTILAIHFNDEDRLEKMKTKVWFKSECENSLNQALDRAKEIHNTHTAVKPQI